MTQQLFSKQLNNNWDSHDFFDLLDLLDFAWHRAEKNIIISSSLRSVHKRIREIALDWSIILCHVLCLKPSSLLLGHKIGIGTDPPSFARFLPSGVAWLRICPNRQIRIVTGLATNIWRGSCCPCSYLYLTPSPCNQKIRQKSDKITNYRVFYDLLDKMLENKFQHGKVGFGKSFDQFAQLQNLDASIRNHCKNENKEIKHKLKTQTKKSNCQIREIRIWTLFRSKNSLNWWEIMHFFANVNKLREFFVFCDF